MDEVKQFQTSIKTKPCHYLGYCPYGSIVEDSPLLEERDQWSCGVFGHQCPVKEYAESFVDDDACWQGA